MKVSLRSIVLTFPINNSIKNKEDFVKKLKVALINHIHYFKFPEGINDIKGFIEFINKNYHSFSELELFIDEGCVAPFFIEEDLKTETQYWNPSNIRQIQESEITILRRYDYEEKLKKVIQERCVHCIHYSEDLCQEDFKSHIENINLNGKCYGFEGKTE